VNLAILTTRKPTCALFGDRAPSRPPPTSLRYVREIDEAEYRRRRAAHEARIDALVRPHLDRRREHAAHPVDDFLFTYYSHRPRALRIWHPGVEACVVGPGAADFEGRGGYVVEDDHAAVDSHAVSDRYESIGWIRRLLAATASRPPMLGCLGLHEWAMVYRQRHDQVRHPRYPLRLGSRGTDEVVESHRIACTHFDAFRFFTDPARPLNVVQPTREAQPANDQPGCLHANMDLYKWSYKLTPLVESELVGDCFELARDIRQLDMQASPYDLSALGVEPIPIETTAGKAGYVRRQRDFADRSEGLRARLIDVCDAALALAPGSDIQHAMTR
jgi:hypothetical protein